MCSETLYAKQIRLKKRVGNQIMHARLGPSKQEASIAFAQGAPAGPKGCTFFHAVSSKPPANTSSPLWREVRRAAFPNTTYTSLSSPPALPAPTVLLPAGPLSVTSGMQPGLRWDPLLTLDWGYHGPRQTQTQVNAKLMQRFRAEQILAKQGGPEALEGEVICLRRCSCLFGCPLVLARNNRSVSSSQGPGV